MWTTFTLWKAKVKMAISTELLHVDDITPFSERYLVYFNAFWFLSHMYILTFIFANLIKFKAE